MSKPSRFTRTVLASAVVLSVAWTIIAVLDVPVVRGATGDRLIYPTSESDSLATLEGLRQATRDRTDLESRRRLADLLAGSDNIEARREAATALDEALRIDDTDVDLWIRLARLRLRQRFLGESRRAYIRALELGPYDAAVWNELAIQELRRYQRFDFDVYLASADSINHRVLALDPHHVGALARQIRIDYMADRMVSVDSLVSEWRRLEPQNAWPRLVRGLLYANRGDFNRAEREFRVGVARLDSLDQVRFSALALVDQEADLASSEAPDSARFVADYWRWRDPTPADAVNQRLIAHRARLVLADLMFALEDRGIRGWEHAPGALLVRFGVPHGWKYRRGVERAEPLRISARATYAPPAMAVNYGASSFKFRMRFIDFAMNGIYVHEPSAFSSTDLFLAGTPGYYEIPFDEPVLEQDVEVLRFVDRTGRGRIEVAVALEEEAWSSSVLSEPERLVTKIAVYDEHWTPLNQTIQDWTPFRRDEDGRLIALWRFDGTPDSAVVGLETFDLDGQGRAAQFEPKEPMESGEEGLLLSDVAFLRDIAFDDPESPYARVDGSAVPNPGHRYAPGEAVTVAFEAYHLMTGDEGTHRAQVRVSVGKQTRRGLKRILFGKGGGSRSELVFVSDAPGARLEQLLGIAVPFLEEGEYVLQVEVEDLLARDVRRVDVPFEVKARRRSTE